MWLPVLALKKIRLKEPVVNDSLLYGKKLVMTLKCAFSAQKIKPSGASLKAACPAG